MFAIQPPQQAPGLKEETSINTCTPNILPCQIHYDGPVKALERYWAPTSSEKDKSLQTAYFRGRKLRGRRVAIPDGYEGVIASHTDRKLPTSQKNSIAVDEEEEVMEVEEDEPVKILEKHATFDSFVVWGHETIPAADDAFVKGVEEWVKLATAMHTQNDEQAKKPTT